eukprot:jgi/Tetstr1/429179/TSEL_019132.t1
MAIAERLANELMMELADRLRRRFEVVHLHALLHAWLDHADYRRALEGLKEAAEQQHRRRRLSASWRAWRTHTVTLLAVRSSIAVAHTAWAFDRWRANASDSRRDRLLNQCSGALADHRRDRLLSSAFVAWVEQWRISRIFRLQEGRRARAAEAALSGLLMPSSAGVRYGWVHSSSALSSTPSGAENCVKIPTLASEATPPRQCWDRSGLGGLHELVAALERRHRAGGAGAAAPDDAIDSAMRVVEAELKASPRVRPARKKLGVRGKPLKRGSKAANPHPAPPTSRPQKSRSAAATTGRRSTAAAGGGRGWQ